MRKNSNNDEQRSNQSVNDSALALGRSIVRKSKFLAGKSAPAFSYKIDTKLTLGQARLGGRIGLPQASNPIAQDLMTDLFWTMFQKNHTRKQNPPRGRDFSRQLLNHITNSPTFKQGKRSTAARPASSIAAAQAILQELLEDDEMREMMEQLSQIEQESSDDNDKDEDDESNSNSSGKSRSNKGKSKKGNQGQGDQDNEEEGDQQDESPEGDGDENNDGEGEDQDGEGDGENNQDQDQDQEDEGDGNSSSQAIIDRLKEKLESIEGSIGASAAISEGFEEGKETGKLIASLGYSENDLSPEDVEKVLAVVGNEDFKNLANLIGRSYGTARDVLRGRSTMSIYLDEAGETKEIDDLFTDELALMSTIVPDGVRREQIMKFARTGLAGMTRTSQNQYGGIKIFAIDESGSTDSEFVDTVLRKRTGIKVSAVERGLVLGLARAAKSQGQDWYLFGWSSADEYTETVTSKDRVGKLMDFIAHNIDGGSTSFDTALGRSMEIIRNLPEDSRYQADIVILTDGQGYLHDRSVEMYKELKREYGCRLYVITIGSNSNDSLEEIADYVLPFTSMADASGKMAELMWVERDNSKRKE